MITTSYGREFYKIGFLRYRVNVMRNSKIVKTGDIRGCSLRADNVAYKRMVELMKEDRGLRLIEN